MYIIPFLTVPQTIYPISQCSFGLLLVFDIAQSVAVEIMKDSCVQQFMCSLSQVVAIFSSFISYMPESNV